MDAKIKPLDKHSFEKSIAKMIAHGTEGNTLIIQISEINGKNL